MSTRLYLFALCATVLFAAVLNVSGAEEKVVDERGLFSGLLKNALKLLGNEFGGAAEECLKEAAHECKKDILHPGKLIKCAGNFIKENKGACLLENV